MPRDWMPLILIAICVFLEYGSWSYSHLGSFLKAQILGPTSLYSSIWDTGQRIWIFTHSPGNSQAQQSLRPIVLDLLTQQIVGSQVLVTGSKINLRSNLQKGHKMELIFPHSRHLPGKSCLIFFHYVLLSMCPRCSVHLSVLLSMCFILFLYDFPCLFCFSCFFSDSEWGHKAREKSRN